MLFSGTDTVKRFSCTGTFTACNDHRSIGTMGNIVRTKPVGRSAAGAGEYEFKSARRPQPSRSVDARGVRGVQNDCGLGEYLK